ncbi:pilus assembly protein PilQ [Sulfurihydrogenibium sp.]|jgi:type IV pilus assembly protein PilQ|uniref:pilus assembly protein PilQ n=1 Tax=Sulfurihydrogenibium sp. TaxID=2053621 RepID=UPI002614F41C|nr:pilus assembly protein PilQ [Sulfurihydrogenibium sp.]
MRNGKKLIVASIAGLTLSVDISYAEKLSAEFTNAKLSTVVDAISQISNFNVIWDKDAIGQKDKLVSIAIRKPIESESLFNLVLLENGLIPVKEGGVYKIKVADEYFVSVPPEIIKAFGKDMFNSLVSQVKKYASPAASIKVDNLSYSILVKDDKDNINRLKNVITSYLDSIKKQSEDLAKIQEKEGQFIKKEFNIPYETFKSIEDKIAENLGVFGKYDYDKSKEKLIVFDTKENITKITRIVGQATQEKVETKCFYARGLDPGELIENIKEKDLSENGTIVFKSKETVQVGSSTTNTAQPIQVGVVSDTVKPTQTMIANLPRICITDTPKVIEKIKYKYSDYLLDRPYQIAIEARIVQVSTSNLKDLGIQWGGLASNIDNNNTKIITGGGSTSAISTGRYAVDFPANATFPGGFAIGFVLGGLQNFLDIRLSALQSIGRSKILSKPQIVTIDGETAEITQGYEVPYVTGVTATTPGNVQFKKAVLKLNVTPRTTADGNIIMDLIITQDIPDFKNLILGNPPIQTKTVTSKVVAKDGSVIAIGGILEKTEDLKNSGVPGLMNIPIFGNLFKETYKQEKTNELLIFLSPKIVYE